MSVSNLAVEGHPLLQSLLGRLECVKQVGPNQWKARCPAHRDNNPSLSIRIGENGSILVYCHAGCVLEKILGAIGVTASALRPQSGSLTAVKQGSAVYSYRDEQGQPLFEVVRFYPKRFVQRRPDGNGGYLYKLNGVRRVLYRLPEILGADPSRPVFIVEGEKDADRLVRLGIIATTCPGGAGKWRHGYSETLAGRNVIIIPDNDEVGHRHGERIARSLAETAETIRILILPDVVSKGDVSDWLDAGGSREQLLALAVGAPEWSPRTSQEADNGAEMVALDSSTLWDSPIPFGTFELPDFPLDGFPERLSILRDMCSAVAESFQVPLDLPAMLALAVGSTALAKRIEVHVQGDHSEPVNLYSIVVLSSGERKSAVFRIMTEPVQAFEREEAKRLAEPLRERLNQHAVLVGRLKHLRQLAARDSKEKDRKAALEEAKAVANQINDLGSHATPRILADDVTPEKLVSLMYEQGGRIAVLSPEGDVFDMMGGRYSKNAAPNLGVYLKAHAGDDILVDRVSADRPAEHVVQPALTLGLTVQPEVLRGLVNKPGLRGRGLVARFLYSVPQSRLGGRRLITRRVPEKIVAGYRQLVCDALRIGPRERSDGPGAYVIVVGSKALEMYLKFAEEIEAQLGPGGDLELIRDWGGKLPGAVARIAGIFHGMMHARAASPSASTVNAETMEAAILVGQYLVEHAKAAFFMIGSDPGLDRAKRIAEWLQRKKIRQFSRRDAFRRFRNVLKVGEIDRPLSLMSGHGFIRLVEHGRSGVGRPKSPVFEVNPHWLGQNGQKDQNSNED